VKFLPLIWKSLWRRKVRTTFTLLSIFIAFLLFGILMTIRAAFSIGIDLAGMDRLIIIHKISLIMPLPESYEGRLETVPGVETVTNNSWFGGIYQDPKNFFAQIAVEPEKFLAIYKEFRLPEDQKKAWLEDRKGAIVGRALADRFGWKVGDHIPLQATIWQPKGGGLTWDFNLVGIYDGDPGVDTTSFYFHYDYLDENRAQGEGMVGWYVVKVKDPKQSQALARTFDQMFENSNAETKTTTEKGFVEGFAKQIGDIGSIMMAILAAVMFTILLVVGNTMAQAVRERTSELAVLKTLGFSNTTVLALVLAESLFVAALGGGLGLAAAWGIVQMGDPTNGLLPAFYLPKGDLVVGVGLMIAVGVAAGILPAAGAMRLKITDALRKA
jgi:putative ABC transport system permease protein